MAAYLHIPLQKIEVIYNPIDLITVERKKNEDISEDLKYKLK
ncbi:MAG: hypothetical protein WCP92_09145 [bacterium]